MRPTLRLAATLVAALLVPHAASAEGDFLYIADASADPCGLGAPYGAIFRTRITTGETEVVSCGNLVDTPLVIPPGTASIFRSPRAVAVDPRDGSLVLADADSTAAGITAVAFRGDGLPCGPPIADPPGRLFRIDPTNGHVTNLVSDGTISDPKMCATSQSAFVNPQAVAFNRGCGSDPDNCVLWVVDSTANFTKKVSANTGYRPGTVYAVSLAVATYGRVEVRSDGSSGPKPGTASTAFGRLRGLAVAPPPAGPARKDTLYVADSSADPQGLGVAGSRPGTVWRIGGDPNDLDDTKIFQEIADPLPALITPNGVAIDTLSAGGLLYVVDSDATDSANPRKALAGTERLPGMILVANASTFPRTVVRTIDGSNLSAPLPACFTSSDSIFINPIDIQVIPANDLCRPDRTVLAVVDQDAHPTCGRIAPVPLTESFDNIAPGAVIAMDEFPLLGTPQPVRVAADGSTGSAFPTRATSFFSSPQRAARAVAPVWYCRDLSERLAAVLFALGPECFPDFGESCKSNWLALNGMNAMATGYCDCTEVLKLLEQVSGKLTCDGACADPIECEQRYVEVVCRLCLAVGITSGCVPPPICASCPTQFFTPACP